MGEGEGAEPRWRVCVWRRRRGRSEGNDIIFD